MPSTPFDLFRARLAVSSLFFLHGLCFSSWGARIPAIQERLGLSEAGLGTLLLAMPVGSIASTPLIAWLVRIFGSRKILVVAISIYSLTLVALGITHHFLIFAGFLILFGLASNLVNVSLNTQALELERLYEKPIMAFLHGLWSVAGFAGGVLGALMIGLRIQPEIHFFIVMILVLMILGMSAPYLIREIPTTEGQTHPKLGRKHSVIIKLGIITFCSMLCEGAMFDWSGVYFKKVVLAEDAWISSGYVAFMITMAGTRFFADGFKRRFGLDRVLRMSGYFVFVGLVISVLFPYLSTAILGFFLVGSGVSSLVPLVFSEAGKTKTMGSSAAIAAVSSIGFFGFLIGPPLIGWIADITHLRVSFCIIAVMGLCISFLSSSAVVVHTQRKA